MAKGVWKRKNMAKENLEGYKYGQGVFRRVKEWALEWKSSQGEFRGVKVWPRRI